MGIELRPQTVYKTDSAHPIIQHLAYLKTAVGEAVSPIVYPRPGMTNFKNAYSPIGFDGVVDRVRDTLGCVRARVGIAFAERADNQVMATMPDPFVGEYRQALELIDHHGKPHVKRVRAGIEILDEHAPEVHLSQWIRDAQLRFSWHDANQAYQEYRILQGELSSHIDSKYGHGLGGAVMVLAQYKEYARALHISEEHAKKISFAASLMIISHDVPNQIKKTLGLTHEQQISAQDAMKGGFDGLRTAFETGTLDLFSLCPQDMCLLLHDIKQRKGFDTYFGLGPVFEQQFADVLSELSSDTIPLLQNLSVKEKDAIKYATLIATIADIIDMILPNDESFARMFTVPRSINQGLSWNIPRDPNKALPKTYNHVRPYYDFFQKYGSAFWQEAQKLSVEEMEVLQRILQGKTKTDSERKLLEVYEIGNIVHGTKLAKNPTIQNMMQHYQGMTLVDIRHQVSFFMKGDREAITQHIHHVFEKRLADVEEKIGHDHPHYLTWQTKLQEEADYVIDCLGRKPTGIHIYDPEEIASFERVAKMIERAFWIQQFQQRSPRRGKTQQSVDEYVQENMDEFERKYELGERPVPPTKRYDSTGNPHNARTIFPVAA